MCIKPLQALSQSFFESANRIVIEPAVAITSNIGTEWDNLDRKVKKLSDENLPSQIAPIVQKAFKALPYIALLGCTPPLVCIVADAYVMTLMVNSNEEIPAFEKNISNALAVHHSILAGRHIVQLCITQDLPEVFLVISNVCFATIFYVIGS